MYMVKRSIRNIKAYTPKCTQLKKLYVLFTALIEFVSVVYNIHRKYTLVDVFTDKHTSPCHI